jgi:hypothetical protein
MLHARWVHVPRSRAWATIVKYRTGCMHDSNESPIGWAGVKIEEGMLAVVTIRA